MTLLALFLLVFLAGVGLGVFVLGSRVRQLILETVATERSQFEIVRTQIERIEAGKPAEVPIVKPGTA